MITLTREQKIQAYKYVLDKIAMPKKDIIKNGNSMFACIQLTYWLQANMKDTDSGQPLQYFPEFLLKKPDGRGARNVWWDDDEHHLRVVAVEECLIEITNS